MKLKEWGERNIISFLAQTFDAPKSIIGIGDDCAVIPLNNEENLLITVDALAEDIHFLSSMLPEDLGYKSVMVNVSDIASMGGKPEYLFLAHALPRGMDVCWLQSFFHGFKQACEKTNTTLLGGDTIGSKDSIFLSVTVIGKAKKKYTKYRSQAKIGDIICVTGQLGKSSVGLKCLLSQLEFSNIPEIGQLINAHTRPEAHLEQGLWLGQEIKVHAMADISDGVVEDLSNIMYSSHVGALLHVDQLPVSSLVRKICTLQEWDYESLALFGGEEYCLMVTIDAKAYPHLNQKFKKVFKTPLYSIGKIIEQPILKYYKDNKEIQVNHQGFDHFKEVSHGKRKVC